MFLCESSGAHVCNGCIMAEFWQITGKMQADIVGIQWPGTGTVPAYSGNLYKFYDTPYVAYIK